MNSHTTFSKELFAAFRADNREGPVQMMNLIRFHAVAMDEGGEPRSGQAAYAEYSRISAPVLKRVGGRIAWRGQWELGLIGPEGERWDVCFIAEFPSVSAFVEMLKDPVYREAMMHRQAGVADSRLIRFRPAVAGSTFDAPRPGSRQG